MRHLDAIARLDTSQHRYWLNRARSFVGDRDDPEDCLSRTLYCACKYAYRYDPHRDFDSWFVTILRYESYEYRKKSRRIIDHEASMPFGDEEYDAIFSETKREEKQGEGLQSNEEWARVQEAMMRIDTRHARILTEYYLHDFSVDQLVEMYKVGSRESIWSRLGRARTALREALERPRCRMWWQVIQDKNL
jgi:RNA polymerase sigma factor (sigma-70 family)